MEASEFDRELIRLAGGVSALRDPAVWHPGLMYQLFRPFWYGDRSLDFLFRHTDFRTRRTVVTGRWSSRRCLLSTSAVKFYTGPALPDTERTARYSATSSSGSRCGCRS